MWRLSACTGEVYYVFILFNIKKDVIEDEFILKQPGGYVPKAVFVEKYDTDS